MTYIGFFLEKKRHLIFKNFLSMTKPNNKKSILYVTYDGILEPLGQSQVLAYLEKLAIDHNIFLLSYEKSHELNNADLMEKIYNKVSSANISWVSLKYHKQLSILSTSFDIFRGFLLSFWLIRKHKIKIIHARSYVPSVIAISLKKFLKIHFIFDMRGFWADERVDGGLWKKKSIIFSIAKWFEKKFLENADHIVSLTNAGIKVMKEFPYLKNKMPAYSVIPTCADLEIFKITTKEQSPFTLGYVGSVGLWYDFDTVLVCFKELLKIKHDAKFLILNKDEHDFISQKLKDHDISLDAVELISADFSEIPKYMSSMDAGIFIIKPLFSKQASAPTKLAEFLGCGIPCMSNHGIGDMSEIFLNYEVGIAIGNFSIDECKQGIKELIGLSEDQNTSIRCRDAANKIFSLEAGVKGYRSVYDQLLTIK
jgi:glycosyltransferase involved in cell wall biosynthesis